MSLCMSTVITAPLISTSPSLNSTAFGVNSISHASILKNKYRALCSLHGFNSRNFRYDPMLTMTRRNFVVRNNITPPPGVPLPSGSPSGSLNGWVLCMVLTFVLPFITHKWGPLTTLKNKVDTTINMVEHIVETIGEVAGKVDKVIDNITDDLPQDSDLKKRLEAFDEVVEGVAKTAHIADDIIDKVEEAEDKLESLILSEAKEEKVSKQVVEKVEIPTPETSALKIE